MQCEVCGCRIGGKPLTVIIEGAKLTCCVECARLGKVYHEEFRSERIVHKSSVKPVRRKEPILKKEGAPSGTSTELVEDFGSKIRQAREKLGLSHEELGKRINEKVSVLRKIETGKMEPDDRLTTILERTLKIKLLVLTKNEKASESKTKKMGSRELTLGDIVRLGNKDVEREDMPGRSA